MGIKVKAIERNVSFSKKESDADWKYVMQPELYGQLGVDKVVAQASLVSGLSKGVLNASLNAYGEVVKNWATEGHSIPIPGLGSMRFGLRSTAVANVADVSASLITSRRVIFVPSTDIKQALADTSVNITCYDRTAKVVKTVSSSDKDNVEDNDNPGGTTPGGSNPGSGSQAGGSGSGSTEGGGTGSDGDNTVE